MSTLRTIAAAVIIALGAVNFALAGGVSDLSHSHIEVLQAVAQ